MILMRCSVAHLRGGLSISVNYYLSGVYVLRIVSCCVLDYVCLWNAIGLPG